MRVDMDKQQQPMIEWQMAGVGWKRAWIQDRTGTDKDWAGTGRYLNVVRVESPFTGPGGNATDFPIWSQLSDEQILEAFVQSVCAVTGCEPIQAPPPAD
jgi:hypothetical protein